MRWPPNHCFVKNLKSELMFFEAYSLFPVPSCRLIAPGRACSQGDWLDATRAAGSPLRGTPSQGGPARRSGTQRRPNAATPAHRYAPPPRAARRPWLCIFNLDHRKLPLGHGGRPHSTLWGSATFDFPIRRSHPTCAWAGAPPDSHSSRMGNPIRHWQPHADR